MRRKTVHSVFFSTVNCLLIFCSKVHQTAGSLRCLKLQMKGNHQEYVNDKYLSISNQAAKEILTSHNHFSRWKIFCSILFCPIFSSTLFAQATDTISFQPDTLLQNRDSIAVDSLQFGNDLKSKVK